MRMTFFKTGLIIIFLSHLIAPIILAQGSFPGMDCGNADGVGDQILCCTNASVIQQPGGLAGGLLNKIPLGLSSLLSGVGLTDCLAKLNQLNRTNAPTACYVGYPQPDATDPNCICVKSDQITPSPLAGATKLCDDYLKNSKEYGSCVDCAQKGGVWSSIGCVHGTITSFITEIVFGLGLSIGGVISFGCMLWSAIKLQLSKGDAEKITKAKELLTSCLIGFIIITFSIFIMRVVGVDILRIPGFGV